MKRNLRARKTVALTALAVCTTLATTMGATASAAQPAASVDVSDGSSQPEVTTNADSATLIDAFVGLTKSTAGVLAGAATPEVSNEGGALNIVLDPSSVPGLAQAFAPSGNHSGLKPTKSQDSAGNTVVFPTSGTLTSGFGNRGSPDAQGTALRQHRSSRLRSRNASCRLRGSRTTGKITAIRRCPRPL